MYNFLLIIFSQLTYMEDYFRQHQVMPSIYPIPKDKSARYIIGIIIVIAIIISILAALYFTGVFNKKKDQQ